MSTIWRHGVHIGYGGNCGMHHNIWQAHLPCKRSFTFAGNTPDECRRICKQWLLMGHSISDTSDSRDKHAYSIHHYAPWIMSLLATYGYFSCGALGDVLSEVPSGPKREWRQRCMSVQSSSSDSCFEDATCSGFPCQDHSDST